MIERSSFATGKATVNGQGPNTTFTKKLYVKLYALNAEVYPSRSKKNPKYLANFEAQISLREWPTRKNGPVCNDPGFLADISALLKSYGFKNVDQLQYQDLTLQQEDKVRFFTGPDLGAEFIERKLVEIPV
jgi:hypothetical protein